MKEKPDRDALIIRARIMSDSFYRCPNTGRILVGLRGDDKVMCNCCRSNPDVPQERTEQTGTHIVRYLERVTAEQYVDQGLANQTVR